jgi:hypothetical protein
LAGKSTYLEARTEVGAAHLREDVAYMTEMPPSRIFKMEGRIIFWEQHLRGHGRPRLAD